MDKENALEISRKKVSLLHLLSLISPLGFDPKCGFMRRYSLVQTGFPVNLKTKNRVRQPIYSVSVYSLWHIPQFWRLLSFVSFTLCFNLVTPCTAVGHNMKTYRAILLSAYVANCEVTGCMLFSVIFLSLRRSDVNSWAFSRFTTRYLYFWL